jgi:DNA-directed RNA polymerase specialized sigma24 family protein
MGSEISADSFSRLLLALDQDQSRAAEKYEDLRRTLIRFFQWRGAPFPEEQTDETFNRVARKLGERVEIRNIGAYCYEVARLICMEALKGKDARTSSLSSLEVDGTIPAFSIEDQETELRLECLDKCLETLSIETHSLLLDYYREDSTSLIERRKQLARKLGLQREALANRVQRLRDKLQLCVTRCMQKKRSI